jgi:hypothetical protein
MEQIQQSIRRLNETFDRIERTLVKIETKLGHSPQPRFVYRDDRDDCPTCGSPPSMAKTLSENPHTCKTCGGVKLGEAEAWMEWERQQDR